MTRWSRTTAGWAVNLDGTDAALAFSLPRVEVRSSPGGWQSACFLADGRQTEWTAPYPGGSAAAMADALAHLRRLVGAAAPAA